MRCTHCASDAWSVHERAVTSEFVGSDYGQIVKTFQGEPPLNAVRRYSPDWAVGVGMRGIFGSSLVELISISYVERDDLHVRLDCRQFHRLAIG